MNGCFFLHTFLKPSVYIDYYLVIYLPTTHPSGPVVKFTFHRIRPFTVTGSPMIVPCDPVLCTPMSVPFRTFENARTFTALVVLITSPVAKSGLAIGEMAFPKNGSDVGGTGVGGVGIGQRQ